MERELFPEETFPDASDQVSGEWWITPAVPQDKTPSAWNKLALLCLDATRQAFAPFVTWSDRVPLDVQWVGDGAPGNMSEVPDRLTESFVRQLLSETPRWLITGASRTGTVTANRRPGPFDAAYVCVLDQNADAWVPAEASISVETRLHSWLRRPVDRRSESLERALRRWEELIAAPIEEWSVAHGWIKAERYGFEVLK